MVKGFVAIDSTPYGNYYSKSDIWWLKQIEWMAKLFPVKLLKSAMAKQNAATETGRSNMAAMIGIYDKTELCHLMGIGYAGFLEDNRVCEIPCPVLLSSAKRIIRERSKPTIESGQNAPAIRCCGFLTLRITQMSITPLL